MTTTTCPWCGSRVDAEYVDVGVGYQRITPYTCDNCGAEEFNPYHDNTRATTEEVDMGWWCGSQAVNPYLDQPPKDLACPDCDRNTKRLEDQESRFQNVRAAFEIRARAVLDDNSQMKRTISNLQAELRVARDGEALENLRRQQVATIKQYETAITDLRTQLEKALGKPAPAEDVDSLRFSLLDVE